MASVEIEAGRAPQSFKLVVIVGLYSLVGVSSNAAVLTEGRFSPTLKALGRHSAVRVKLDIGFDDRLPDQVELAAD